ncbi:MAG: thiolase family protein, partial [Desulfocucumaceae bacterium]
MKDVVIIDAVRTPTGVFGGMLKNIGAPELQTIVFNEIIRRTGIDVNVIDETIVGCSFRPSDAPNIGRVAGLMSGLPVKTPGSTIDVNCASGLKALGNALTDIRAGEADVVLVGGVESMSNIPYLLKGARFGYRLNHG